MQKVGDGTRILNFMVDGFLVFMMSFALFKYWNFYVVYWQFKPINFWYFIAASIIVYYNFFELIWGRTPGKWLSGSKVVHQNGGKPGLLQIIFRTFLRLIVIDFFFIACWGKPLHDKLSGTEVVTV